ncbi:MAG: prolyl oligopeptidase family serine peptidase [Verrucomicrobiae bacterium]|nr:prolyl oligopeptidase family serine peptidase [Verrucomicrobiae bacterium]
MSRSRTQPAKTEVPDGNVYKLIGGKVSENLEAARRASPVTHISADDPPLLILHGDKDTTVYLDQSEILRDRYLAAGLEVKLVVVPGGKHGFGPRTPQDRELLLATVQRWLKPAPEAGR